MRFWAVSLLCLLSLVMSTTHADPVRLTSSDRTQVPPLKYITDSDSSFSWSDFQHFDWQSVEQVPAQFGYSDASIWLTFEYVSDSRDAHWLSVDYPLLDFLDIYFFDHSGHLLAEHSLGDRLAFEDRWVLSPVFIVPIPDSEGQAYTAVMRVRSESSIEVPLRIQGDIAFRSGMESSAWLQGLFFGAVLMLGIYHALIFVASGDRSYLYFGGLAIAMALIQATIWGRSYQFLWPQSPDWNQIAIGTLINCSNFFGILYVSKVVKLRESYPRLFWLVGMVATLSALMAIMSLLVPYRLIIQPTLLMSLTVFTTGALCVLLRMKDRYPPAFAVFVAACMYTLGSSAYILGKLQLLPNSVLLDHALIIGLLLQVMLFAFALSVRMRMDRELRERAQRDSTYAKDMLLETERQQNMRLDQEVRARTKQLEEANARLQKISTTDALTGLYNRRSFDDTLQREHDRCARERHALSVIMLDIDHFKKLNDNYGHAFGDEALRQTALRVQDVLKRPADMAFRYGGEEFAILLPDTPGSAAKLLARQIWTAMRSEAVVVGEQSVRLTVSLGVASADPVKGHDAYALVEQADARLYEAKASGRDRIV